MREVGLGGGAGNGGLSSIGYPGVELKRQIEARDLNLRPITL